MKQLTKGERRMKKILSIAVCMMLLLTLAVGCGSKPAPAPGSETETPAEDRYILVGVPGPFSGSSASQGEALRAGVELAVSEVNETGIDIGGTVYRLKPVYIDTENSAEIAASAYTKLCTTEKVDLIVGETSSSVALAVMDVIAEYQMPTIFAIPSSDALGEKVASDHAKYGTVWMVDPASSKMQDGVLTFFADATGSQLIPNEKKEIAIISEDSDWGKSVRAAWVNKMDELGWKITVDEVVSSGETDFYSILQKVKDNKPDIIKIEFTSVTSGASVTKQIDELGLDGYIVFGGYYMKQGEFHGLVGKLADYHMNILESFDLDFEKNLLAQSPNVSPTTAVWGYDAIHIAAKACERAQTLDKAALNDCIAETDHEGALMRTVFDAETHFTISGEGYKYYGAAQYFDGAWTTVFPYETAKGTFQRKP